MTRIEIYINKERADIIDDEIHLRLNKEMWNPEKTATRQAEWSFSFDLPSTPANNKIFSHASVLSVNGKFHQRYDAQVYADGILIYDGSLIVNEYNARTKKYNCNLVNVKVNTLDDIFGEETLTDAKWYVPFSGVPTINEVNADEGRKYYFPFICYGAFQKWPTLEDEVGKIFTPKHTIDGSNKFWVESFPPSLNVMEEVRRLFENKGYDVGGTAYQDADLANIYASCNLADGQSPILNVGNELFGDVDMTITFDNEASSDKAYVQQLKYKYERVPKPKTWGVNEETRTVDMFSRNTNDYDYNFGDVIWWNLMQQGTVANRHKQYIYDPNEMMIVVPADGWYQIRMDCDIRLNAPLRTFSAKTNVIDYETDEIAEKDVTYRSDMVTSTPCELQLIRNYDQNIELIKGKNNRAYVNGNPADNSYTTPSGMRAYNVQTWQTCYPHERLKMVQNPTSTNDLLVGGGSLSTSFQRYDEGAFVYGDRETMAYDPCVSEAFICGFSSLSDGTVAVQKDGRSWSPMSSTHFDTIANVKGYYEVGTDGITSPSNKNANSYNTAGNTNYCTLIYDESTPRKATRMVGVVQCCVYLKKNDLLEVALVEKAYDGEQKYSFSGSVNLHVKAFSDETKEQLKADTSWNMYSDSRFPTELNLFNFTNKDKKKSDFINDVITAFNLELFTQGKTVTINTNKGIKKDFMNYAVDIDDRASSDDAISSRIDYPRTMSVKYSTNTEEIGFENSVPLEYINSDDWEEHGDSGYTVIQLSDDSYVTNDTNTQTSFSYTYYDSFTWFDTSWPLTDSGWTTTTASTILNVPILAESRYFIESESDEEGMKHDGHHLPQRFWFRQATDSQAYVRCADINHELVYLSIPTNKYYGLNLSYKDTEKSLLTEFWNVHPLLDSNYVSIEVRITPQEYLDICNGAKVVFDEDIYYVARIEGYDPTNVNLVTLVLVKKTD